MKRQQCKRVLEQHYKVSFRRSSINSLSIDFYNSSLMIGLQDNSVHHYIPKFHKSYSKFVKTQREDVQRKQMCKEAGIRLICIPYNTPRVPGRLSRILKNPNKCSCEDCLNIKRVNEDFSK